MGGLAAGEVREVLARYGAPRVDDVDRLLVSSGVAVSSPVPRGGARCDPLAENLHVTDVSGAGRLLLWSLDGDVTILVRRFGEAWLHLDDLPHLEGRALTLPALESDVPWQVLAIGACART